MTSFQFEKVSLLVKGCQAGKTRNIMQSLSELSDDIISVLFTDNSLLQSNQLKHRIDGFDGIEEGRTIVLSSKSKVKSIDALPVQIMTKGVKNVITCSNATRLKHIDSLLNMWLETFSSIHDKKFNIFIDEGDKNINMFKPYLEKWNEHELVNGIVMITATPYKVLKELGEVKIIKLDETYDENTYHRFQESEFKIYEMKNKDKYYAEKVLDMAKENGDIKPKNVYYFPGNVKKVSHYNIKNKCLDYGFNVITINCDGTKLFNNHNDKKKFKKINTDGQEVSVILGELYENEKLYKKPLAITGANCIGRGITLSSPKMMLSHGILPPTYTNISNLYQSGGRLVNNYKQDESFKKPIIYCTRRVRNSIELSEQRAVKMAVKAKKFNIDKISIDEYTMCEKKYHVKQVELYNMKQVEKFLERITDRCRNLSIHEHDGFFINARVTGKKVEDLTPSDRLLKADYDKLKLGYPMTKQERYMVYPIYNSINDKEVSKFIICFKIY